MYEVREVQQGKRRKITLYRYEGYQYGVNHRTKKVHYLLCSKQSCKAKGYLYPKNLTLVLKGVHNHRPRHDLRQQPD